MPVILWQLEFSLFLNNTQLVGHPTVGFEYLSITRDWIIACCTFYCTVLDGKFNICDTGFPGTSDQ
jgi:hypothetical protein